MTATAIILARAGSKGLPGKNTAIVAGRPCLAWTIDDARSAAGVGQVVVSSDDMQALAVARAAGVEAVARPPALAADDTPIDAAARHTHGQIGSPGGPVVILYANVPARPEGLIDRAIDTLVRTGADSVQSYAPVGKHHPWWTARVDPDTGVVAPWAGEVLNHGCFRRQDLPPACVPDGGVIAVTPDALHLRVGAAAGAHAFFGKDRRAVQTREGEVVDIDTEIDLLVADAVLRRREARADLERRRANRSA